ncbi:hypothetical protein HanRHA438_Chr04g0150741 [Helianthus annuus]|nr:hypothetical protein HanRHA438_Chr04g0150741 [Helianthus annuus]
MVENIRFGGGCGDSSTRVVNGGAAVCGDLEMVVVMVLSGWWMVGQGGLGWWWWYGCEGYGGRLLKRIVAGCSKWD